MSVESVPRRRLRGRRRALPVVVVVAGLVLGALPGVGAAAPGRTGGAPEQDGLEPLTGPDLVTGPDLPGETELPAARGIDRVCPPPVRVAEGDGSTAPLDEPPSFPDLGTTHAEAITCAAGYRLVSGFGDGTFRPEVAISRGQMATFVASWLRTATGVPLPAPADPPFIDTVDSVHAGAIAQLAEAGIVSGRSDGRYEPEATLTRGQFTQAVANAISYADVFAVGGPLPPAPEQVRFVDVAGTTFETTIGALAEAGIATGTSGGRFEPNAAVTRGQLTTFLLRSADYLDRYQRWRPTARSVVLVASLAPVTDPEDTNEPIGVPATLLINGFNGTVAFLVDTGALPPLGDDAAFVLRARDPVLDGPGQASGAVVLELADAELLGSDPRFGIVSGTAVEADSTRRFADLVEQPDLVMAELSSPVLPGGVVRGALTRSDRDTVG